MVPLGRGPPRYFLVNAKISLKILSNMTNMVIIRN
jgi:hypothetical protein